MLDHGSKGRSLAFFVKSWVAIGASVGCSMAQPTDEGTGMVDSELGAGSIRIGETSILALDDSGNAGLELAQPATLSTTATIHSLSFYVTRAAGTLRLGVYDATGPNGGPGALKASAAEITPTRGWNKANVTTPITLAPGTYWLSYMPSDNGLHFRRSGSGGPYSYCPVAYGAMPSKFCTSPATGGDHWSFYATLTQTSSPPPPVAGACGTANGVATSSAPSTGLCSAGTASSVSGTGPWTWSCAGQNGGTTATCSAPALSAPPPPPPPPPSGTEVPGPSPALFAVPFYSCAKNIYVSPTGSDANDGSAAKPWATVQHANDAGRTAGDCVNVAPGTYKSSFWTVTHGGNVASAGGYVVYRCTTLNGCVMSDTSGAKVAVGVNYVVFDGFDFAASSAATYGIGLNAWDDGGTSTSNHHIWALNNKIHGYGQSGIQFNDGEYYFSIHNAAYDNSHVTCDAQGSGISYVVEKAAPGYTPTAADQAYAPFHNVVSWNDVHDNILTKCGTASNPYDTDGNGIIMDTLSNAGGTNVDYPYPTLVSFNVTHDNGGGGVHIFLSNHVTVANNTAYNNHLDPFNTATYRPEIGVNNNGLSKVGSGPSNVFLNNIAYAKVGSGYLTCNAAFSAGGNGSDASFQNNVSYIVGTGCNGENPTWNGDVFSCSANKCGADPHWVTPGSNFALQASSAAIGYGQTESYLSTQAVDVGACDHLLAACP